MAMTGPGLATAIKSALDAEFGPADTPELEDDRQRFCDVVSAAVVSYIQSNALVTVTVASVGGVTPGVGTSGPGAGTGTIS